MDVLADPDHCGRCDHGCGGQACTEGRCAPQALADRLFFVDGLASQGGTLYATFTTPGSDDALLARLDGDTSCVGRLTESCYSAVLGEAGPVSSARGLAATATRLFTAAPNGLHRIDPHTGSATRLENLPAYGLRVADDQVYWWGEHSPVLRVRPSLATGLSEVVVEDPSADYDGVEDVAPGKDDLLVLASGRLRVCRPSTRDLTGCPFAYREERWTVRRLARDATTVAIFTVDERVLAKPAGDGCVGTSCWTELGTLPTKGGLNATSDLLVKGDVFVARDDGIYRLRWGEACGSACEPLLTTTPRYVEQLAASDTWLFFSARLPPHLGIEPAGVFRVRP